MVRSRRSRSTSTAQLVELGIVAPQVVAHRLTRMAAAGMQPSAGDRRELVGMVVEKQAAFAQGWMAMWVETWLAQQQLLLACLSGGPCTVGSAVRAGAAWERVLARGIAPVRRRAAANARRLSRR
jgi:hypothetical protein